MLMLKNRATETEFLKSRAGQPRPYDFYSHLKPDDILKASNQRLMLLYIGQEVNINSFISGVSGSGDPSYTTLSHE